jgi:hypothetical protein
VTPSDFRRLALSLPEVEQSAHFGSPDFRIGGRIFATLAAQKHGYGNLMLTPEVQSQFVSEFPEIFLPVPGGWGKMGATHVCLAAVTEDVLACALHAAWKLRKGRNAHARPKPRRRPRP